MPISTYIHDDGVIDHETGGNGEGHERQVVEAVAQEIHDTDSWRSWATIEDFINAPRALGITTVTTASRPKKIHYHTFRFFVPDAC